MAVMQRAVTLEEVLTQVRTLLKGVESADPFAALQLKEDASHDDVAARFHALLAMQKNP